MFVCLLVCLFVLRLLIVGVVVVGGGVAVVAIVVVVAVVVVGVAVCSTMQVTPNRANERIDRGEH